MAGRASRQEARVPVQQRGIRTREKIIRAALRLFGRRGYHGTNSNEIAEAAGVSTGSFYAYFGDKKQVFLEALAQYNRDVLGAIRVESAPSGAGGSVEKAFIRALIARALAAHEVNPAFHREAVAMVNTDAQVRALQAGEDRRVMDALEAVMKEQRGPLRVRDTHTAARVVFRAAEGIVHDLALGGSARDRDAILGELADMLHRYLLPG